MFDALWAESISYDSPPRPMGFLWRADVRDIANRREVARFDKEIERAALSPDGRQVAVVTRQRVQGGGPLWVVDLDGGETRQLAPFTGQFFWSRDSRTIFYGVGGESGVGIDRVSVDSGEQQQILVLTDTGRFQPLGWSTDGQLFYYFCRPPTGRYEIWSIDANGQNAQARISLARDPGTPILSPDGSKFLIGTDQGLGWISADGAEQSMFVSQVGFGFSAIWSPDSRELVVSQRQRGQAKMPVQVISAQDGSTRVLGEIPFDEWRLLALSPDNQWLAAFLHPDGLYWIHLPTQSKVPVPSKGRAMVFVGWLLTETGQ